jgi:predicted glycosyltransferase
MPRRPTDPPPLALPGGVRPRLLLFCQYVRGIGHLVRSAELARELAMSFDVCLVNGGQPVPGLPLPRSVRYVVIPAVSRDEESGALVSAEPSLTLADSRATRAAALVRCVEDVRPDILVTEHFPFGLLFEQEYILLLEVGKRVNPQVRIVSSVRDVVLSPGGGADDARTRALLDRWFDLILIHGDEAVIALDDSFPLLRSVAAPHRYTGYVVRSLPDDSMEGGPPSSMDAPPTVIASAGGGRVGGELLEAVVAASPLLATRWRHRLKVFTGPFLPPDAAARLRAATRLAPGAELFAFTPQFHRELARAAVAVGLGGYNTLIETVAAAVPAVAYLRSFRHGDREQELRAVKFREAGLIETLEPAELTPAAVADRILRLVDRGQQPRRTVRLDGAATARRLLEELWQGSGRGDAP